MPNITLVEACTEAHFRDMSMLHALGWRSTYQNLVPTDYMQTVITNDRWINFFRTDYEEKHCQGLLLYRDNTPVSCCNYGSARSEPSSQQRNGLVLSSCDGRWGELISFYSHPEETGKGYGSYVMNAALDRLRTAGYSNCLVFVLRENIKGRTFYESHGFCWDGTHMDIPFPPDTICVDLRYVRSL